MIRVFWPDEVLAQVDQIIAYIDVFNPVAARRLGDRLVALGESLATSPRRGRPAPDGTRELVTVRPYVLRYEIQAEMVVILHIRHSARRPAG